MEDAVRHRVDPRGRARGHSGRAGARRGPPGWRPDRHRARRRRPPGGALSSPGTGTTRRAPLFALTPRLDPELSLAALDGEVASAEAELALATTEALRARELAKGGVVSASELDRAEATLAVAAAHAESARRDAATSRRARGGGGAATEAVVIGAPFDGAVAAVAASAGQAVEAGDELGASSPAARPGSRPGLRQAVAGLTEGPTRVSLRAGSDSTVPDWTNLPAQLVAISPAVAADSPPDDARSFSSSSLFPRRSRSGSRSKSSSRQGRSSAASSRRRRRWSTTPGSRRLRPALGRGLQRREVASSPAPGERVRLVRGSAPASGSCARRRRIRRATLVSSASAKATCTEGEPTMLQRLIRLSLRRSARRRRSASLALSWPAACCPRPARRRLPGPSPADRHHLHREAPGGPPRRSSCSSRCRSSRRLNGAARRPARAVGLGRGISGGRVEFAWGEDIYRARQIVTELDLRPAEDSPPASRAARWPGRSLRSWGRRHLPRRRAPAGARSDAYAPGFAR